MLLTVFVGACPRACSAGDYYGKRNVSLIVHCTLWSVLCLVYTSVCAVIAQATANEPFSTAQNSWSAFC